MKKTMLNKLAIGIIFTISTSVLTPVYAVDVTELIPIGRTAGINVQSDGVIIAKLSGVETETGTIYPAKQAGLLEGDVIISMNNNSITTNEDLQNIVSNSKNDTINVEILRNSSIKEIEITPAINSDGDRKIGVMVQDEIAGIGTITYINPQTGEFGSLGHGICDTNSGGLIPVTEGELTPSSVASVQKGEAGNPGALQGEFQSDTKIGEVYINTDNGIFGSITDTSYYEDLDAYTIASIDEIELGYAQILSNVDGETIETYDISIEKIYPQPDTMDRCMQISITDSDLIEQTGGIVQGMSGSPIIQNGKLIGAVTHVFVNDPTCGYGIFIGNMLEMAESVA